MTVMTVVGGTSVSGEEKSSVQKLVDGYYFILIFLCQNFDHGFFSHQCKLQL